MSSEEILENILNASNYYELSDSMSNFSKIYIEKLVMNIITYIDADISLGEISFCKSYHLEPETSQQITGVPSAYSAVDGNPKVLAAFAESYSHLGIAEYDDLCKEALLDFLNLHNGLYVVELSEKKLCELSLGVPKHSSDCLLSSDVEGMITLIPINFSFGTVTFILLKTDDKPKI